MSYNFLINATKNRIITELRNAFARHPHFKDLEILNKFPYDERVQQGIIVRNSNANRMPLSADNFQGTVFSYVTTASHDKTRSLSVEWVREDTIHLTNRVLKEDFSNQFKNFPQQNRTILLNEYLVKSMNDLKFADSFKSVEVFINGSRVVPAIVDGERKQIILSDPPPTNSTVEVSYWARNMAPPGIYQIEITSGNPDIYQFEFMVDALLDKEQTLTSSSTGYETSFLVNNGSPVFKGSLRLKENDQILNEGSDYLFDYDTGILTFLQNPSLLKGSRVTAKYRVKGLSTGPFNIPNYNSTNNVAIPGVVLAFGRGVSIGDKHFVVITKEREDIALEYSGKWEVSISLDIYAKDSHMIEEVIDITTSNLLFYRKEQLDTEGIALVDVSFGGESEQIFDEATGDLYYTGSVDYQFLTEWILHKPLLRTIDGFEVTVSVFENISDENLIFPGMNRNFERIK